MPKGYWVAFVDVSDPEGYKAYIAENAKAFRKYGGRFLTRGGPYEAPEGKPKSRTVVVEFLTYTAALECYHSPEYAKEMTLRQGRSVMDLAIVEGYWGHRFTVGAFSVAFRHQTTDIVEKVRRTAKSAPTIESRSTAAHRVESGFTFRDFAERHSMQMPWAAATRTFSTISASFGQSACPAAVHALVAV